MKLHPHARVLAPVALALTLPLLAAAPASGNVSVTTQTGNTVFLDSDSASDTMVLSCQSGAVVTGSSSSPVVTSIPCAALSRFEASGAGGNDTFQFSNVTAAQFPSLPETEITTGLGSDTVAGTQIRDLIDATDDDFDLIGANGGDDEVEGGATPDGGPGNDLIIGALGASGGDGDDRIENSAGGPIVGGPGDDVVARGLGSTNNGGAGFDTFEYSDDIATLPAGTVISQTFTDSLYSVDATIPPNPPQSLSAAFSGFEHISGPLYEGGTETFDTTGFSGTTDIKSLGGNDTLLTGPGEDELDAGPGDDVIDPGGGFDVVRGGPGADTLRLRDTGTDRGSCGTDADSVVADASDVLSDCETVDQPTIDNEDPETTAGKVPKKVQRGKKAVFQFDSSDAGSSFQCRVDAGALRDCTSPFSLQTKKLKPGKHSFEAAATDAAGNTDTSPLRVNFKVTQKKKGGKGGK